MANQRFFLKIFFDEVADIRLEAAPETIAEAFAEAAAAIGGEAKAATFFSTSSDATSSSLPVDHASSFLFFLCVQKIQVFIVAIPVHK